MQLLHSCNQLYRRVSLQRHCAIHSLRSAYNLLAYLLLEEDSVESCHQRKEGRGIGRRGALQLFMFQKTHTRTLHVMWRHIRTIRTMMSPRAPP